MSSLSGTAALVGLIVARDRLRIGIWVVAIAAIVVAVAASVEGLYPTQADLEAAARSLSENPSQIALSGPDQGLDTLGGRVAFEVSNIGLIGVALMSAFTVARNTRAEEESGRAELVRATAVGRHAPPAAALVVAAAMSVLVGGAVAFGLIAQDLPASGALALGASFAALGLVFAGVAAVAAQVSENTRVVNAISGATLALAFALRAIGDVGDGTLSWVSPLGWAQASRPFAGERAWPLLLAVAGTTLLVGAAARLAQRRDLGAGLLAQRRGPPVASRRLAGPLGLATRLQRGALIGWSVGALLGGAAFGSFGDDVEGFVGENENVREVLAQGAGDIADSFLATAVLLLALIGAGYAIQSAQRLRGEENAGRADPVLTAAVSRGRWAASHLVLALAGGVAVLAAAGVGVGLTYAILTGDLAELPRIVGAAVSYAPALWVLVGLTTALVGIVPRATPAAWGALAVCAIIGLFGPLLQLPGWLSDMSPYRHIPLLPAAELTAAPLLVLTAVAGVLIAAGMVALRRREIG